MRELRGKLQVRLTQWRTSFPSESKEPTDHFLGVWLSVFGASPALFRCVYKFRPFYPPSAGRDLKDTCSSQDGICHWCGALPRCSDVIAPTSQVRLPLVRCAALARWRQRLRGGGQWKMKLGWFFGGFFTGFSSDEKAELRVGSGWWIRNEIRTKSELPGVSLFTFSHFAVSFFLSFFLSFFFFAGLFNVNSTFLKMINYYW